MEKYWLTLLEHWRSQDGDGLTIPFVIGSQNFLPASFEAQTIEELLRDIAINNEAEVCLKYCLTIGDIVLSITYPEKPRMKGFFPRVNDQSQTGLFVSGFLNDLGESIEEISPALQNDYNSYLEAGLYSKIGRERREYSADDIAFIQSAYIHFQT